MENDKDKKTCSDLNLTHMAHIFIFVFFITVFFCGVMAIKLNDSSFNAEFKVFYAEYGQAFSNEADARKFFKNTKEFYNIPLKNRKTLYEIVKEQSK